jgi:DNA-directed RNA polymerase subunit RPC12/RpoP
MADGPDQPQDTEGVIEFETATSRDLEFPCANCGAAMTWDPDADALACAYCATTVPVPRGEGTVVERPLEAAGDAIRGLGLELRVCRCNTCGASVALEGSAVAERCVYCGSPSVLTQEANRNAIRPESLVPLDVGRATVDASVRRWLKSRWFRPRGLDAVARFDAVGVYVPFWTFDCQVHSDWSADAGYSYWETETYWATENGRRVMRTRRVRKVRWVPAWGARDDSFDDILIHASRGMSPALLQRLGAFDLGQLVPYRPEYLAGWRAEEYQVDLEGGWQAASGIVESTQQRRCAGDVPGDTHRFLRVRNTIRDVRWKHVLLPVWSLQYRFKQRTYTVLVHGQTGRIAGKAPVSWARILLLAALVLGLVAVAAAAAIAAR